MQWCLTIPPAAPPIGPAGMSACLMFKNKMLIFVSLFFDLLFRELNIIIPQKIQFTRIGHAMSSEPLTIIVPFVYDMSTNTIQVAGDRRDGSYMTPNSPHTIIGNMLKRLTEYPGIYRIIIINIKVFSNRLLSLSTL